MQCVNWEKVTSKRTLVDEFHSTVKIIRQDAVLQSYTSWTVRLQRVKKINECYLKNDPRTRARAQIHVLVLVLPLLRTN